jgi:hypothetical protein
VITCRLTLVLLTACTAFDASADDRIACPKDFYVEAKTLSALPEAVRLTLTYAPHESGEISDADGPFNAGDVGGGPHRRLALAAIGLNQVVVALERGGVGYSVEVWMFTQSADGWVGRRQAVVTEGPRSLKLLVDIVCR